MSELLDRIQGAVRENALGITLHAFERMQIRDILTMEVEEAILAETAEIIEDYPADERGASCLILGWTAAGRVLHVQVCYPPLVDVVTTYEPDQEKWINNRTRR